MNSEVVFTFQLLSKAGKTMRVGIDFYVVWAIQVLPFSLNHNLPKSLILCLYPRREQSLALDLQCTNTMLAHKPRNVSWSWANDRCLHCVLQSDPGLYQVSLSGPQCLPESSLVFWEDLEMCKFLIEWNEGERLFQTVSTDKTKGNGHWLKHMKFHLKTVLLWGWSNTETNWPESLQSIHPRRFSKLNLTHSWAT